MCAALPNDLQFRDKSLTTASCQSEPSLPDQFGELVRKIGEKTKESRRRKDTVQGTIFDYAATEIHRRRLQNKLDDFSNRENLSENPSRAQAIEKLKLALIVLNCCESLARQRNSLTPRGEQVIALLFQQKGLTDDSRSRALDAANLMSSAFFRRTPEDSGLEKGSSIFWSGNTHRHIGALRLSWTDAASGKSIRLIDAVFGFLEAHPGQVFSTTELIAKFFPELNREATNNSQSTETQRFDRKMASDFLSSILGICSANGCALRHPDFRRVNESVTTRGWSVRSNEYQRYPATSAVLRVLEHAAAPNGGLLHELIAAPGSKDPTLFRPSSLRLAVRELQYLGFIEVDKQRGIRSPRIRLTPLAEAPVRAWARLPLGSMLKAEIWEPIRKSLLCRIPLRELGDLLAKAA